MTLIGLMPCAASIFKRISEPAPLSKFGAGLADFSQIYRVSYPDSQPSWLTRKILQKFVVHRKIAIGRHERVLAIDGDYIHVSASSLIK